MFKTNMAKSALSSVEITEKENNEEGRSLFHRYIPRSYVAPVPINSVEKTYDFKISEYGAVDVIETGKRDWLGLVASHKDEVGLQNVIRLATAFGLDPRDKPFALKPDEAVDESYQPNSLSEVKAALERGKTADGVLAKYAEELGISKESVLDLMIKGNFASVYQEKVASSSEVEEK